MTSPLLAWRYAVRRPARTLVAALGVAAGVAGLRAIQLGTRSTLDAVRVAYEQAAGPAALVVASAGDSGAPLPPGIVERLERSADVEAVLPLVQIPTARMEELKNWIAPLFAGEVTGVLVVGVDFGRDAGHGRFRVSSGEAAGALAGESWARERRLAPGSALRLMAGRGGVWETRVGGLLAREGLGARSYGQVVVAPIDEVRRAFALEPGTVGEAAVVLDPDAPVAEVAGRLQRELGPAVAVMRPADRGRDVVQRLGNIRAGTDLTSSIALFLASFLIYSMFATAAAERARDTAMLRCVGATRAQAALPLLVEAICVAVPGGVAGGALGSLLARGVSATLSRTAGAELRVPDPDLAGALWAAGVGIAVAVASALLPAVRAARQSPFEGIRARSAAAERPSLRVTLAWGLTGGAALALLLLFPPETAAPARTYVLVMALIASAAGVLPAALLPLTSALGGVTLRLFGGGAALGVAAARWRPLRTGLAAGAVLGCVAMVGAISSLGSGFRIQFSDWADRALGWDLFVRRPSGLDEEALARIRAVPGVRYAAAVSIRPAEIVTADRRSVYLSVVGIEPDVCAEDRSFVFAPGTAGDPAELIRSLNGEGRALVTGVLSGQLGVQVGSEVTLKTSSGPRRLKLVAEIVDYTQNGFALVVSRAFYEQSFGALPADLATVRLAPGADLPSVTAAISAIPGVRVEGRAELKARVMRAVNDSVGAMDGLLYLSGVVGFLAVWAAVALGAIERRSDIAALRSLGMSRAQVAAMICSEAAVTALIGAAIGVGLGLYLGGVFVASTHNLGIPIPYVPPWRALGVAAAIATFSALPAALLPARRAVAISPAEALRDP